ncbi:MAG: universal stress protein [Chthoniobacteraceae bacterium]
MTAPATEETRRATPVQAHSILCGTDFSEESRDASEVAAAMAGRLGDTLNLVYATEVPIPGTSGEKFVMGMIAARRVDLETQAKELGQNGVEVEVSTPVGKAGDQLCELAKGKPTRMIVLASQRKRGGFDRWLLGSVIERTAQRACAPTLVVRDAGQLRAWASGERPLRVFVCFNGTMTSQAALRWAKDLGAIGPCELVIGNVDWPADQYVRFGGKGPVPMDGYPPDVQSLLEREVRARAAEVLGDVPFRLRVQSNWGRADACLAEMAREEAADLVIVGAHQYRGFERLWNTSISRGLLHEAEMNVAVVPLASERDQTPAMGAPVRSVLISTDFSDVANAAITHGYSILQRRGTAHLLHVIAPPHALGYSGQQSAFGTSAENAQLAIECAAKLRALVPPEAAAQGIGTHVKVIESRDVAEAICQTAERLGVDAICLSRQGRSGLAKAVLGSVAEAVLARSRRPLFIIPSTL